MSRIVIKDNIELNRLFSLYGDSFENLKLWDVRVGEIITVTDKDGGGFRARVVGLKKDSAEVFVFERINHSIIPQVEIALFQALPEKERMELIIEKTTELGVSTITPFKSKRSISLAERDSRQKKSHRWQFIALKAAKQCRRATIPPVEPFCTFDEALKKAANYPIKLLLWEKERGCLLKEILKKNSPDTLVVMVGPEGGFDKEEIDTAKKAGFIPVSLGGSILRTETASLLIIGIIRYEWG